MSSDLLDGNLSYVLSHAEQSFNRGVGNILQAEGLTIELWRILKALGDGHGLPMTQLADIVLLRLPTLTKAVDRMVSQALVYRKAHPTDRRKIIVHLSTTGREILGRVEPQVSRYQNGVLAIYGDDRASRLVAELHELMACLPGDHGGRRSASALRTRHSPAQT